MLPQILICVGTIVVSVGLGAGLICLLFKTIDRTAKTPSSRKKVLLANEAELGMHHGMWIGMMERLAVTGLFLSGHHDLLMGVIAIKVLAHWTGAKDSPERPGAVERFTIGTLASLIWAGFCGIVGKMLLTWV